MFVCSVYCLPATEEINATVESGIFAAIDSHDRQLLKKEIISGADLSQTDKDGNNPLICAVSGGDLTIVKMLVTAGADVNCIEPTFKYSPLLLLTGVNANAEIAKFLIEHGADVNAEDVTGRSVIQHALEDSNRELVALLLQKGVKFKESYLSLIKDKLMAETVFSKIPDLDSRQAGLILSSARSKDLVDLMILRGVDVNLRGAGGRTALMNTDDYETARLLIERGAIVNLTDEAGITPLMNSRNTLVSELLCTCGANVNDRDCNGRTALHHILGSEGDPDSGTYPGKVIYDLVRTLVFYGADVNLKDREGLTPLMLVKDIETADFLLDHGAGLEARDLLGNTALWFAAASGSSELLQLYLKAGANVLSRNNEGRTALMNSKSDLAEILIKAGADVNAADMEGLTALMIAAGEDDSEMVGLLLRYNGAVTPHDKDGNTALHHAVMAELWENNRVVELLLKAGADLSLTNSAGRNALDLAKARLQAVRMEAQSSPSFEGNVSLYEQMIEMIKEKSGQN